jgi:pyruvate formate lyase activating enzyme
MTEPDRTGVATLLRAAQIGREEGLHFVYAGNLPGEVGQWEDTRCPGCNARLIERRGFRVVRDRIGEAGAGPECTRPIPGFWKVPPARSERS